MQSCDCHGAAHDQHLDRCQVTVPSITIRHKFAQVAISFSCNLFSFFSEVEQE
jgi:hypothetical protein